MKNITITTKKYDKAGTRSGYRAFTAKVDGKDLTNTIDGKVTAVDFIENAISKAVSNAIDNGETAIDLTVTLPAEITLSAALTTHLTDKYQADEVVNSITFA